MTLALDFGTCNTVLARWNAASRQVDTLRLGNLSREFIYQLPGSARNRRSTVIPTLVHYGENRRMHVGAQVENAGLTEHKGAFRWAKLDMLKGNNQARRINGELVTPQQAADDFIEQVLLAAGNQNHEDLVITVPVEAYDPYVDWLHGSVLRNFSGQVRILDEATACMLGYDVQVREGQVFMVFDFGGGTLDVSIVKVQPLRDGQMQAPRVLGRAGEELGGALVDQWLLEELQQSQQLDGQEIADIGAVLLHKIETAKIRLSGGAQQVEVEQFHDYSGRLISHVFSNADLSKILGQPRQELQGLSAYRIIGRTVDIALERAQDRYGIKKSEVKAVFMAGGSSLLQGVADVVRNLFPGSEVHCHNPFEAIARGACRYAGEDINLSLVHDYCLHVWNPEQKDYELLPIIPKGSRYPSEQALSKKYLKAACDGATKLGVVVYQCATMLRPEPVYRMEGGVLKAVGTQKREEKSNIVLNPKDREFIHADPPCDAGEKRFVAGFGIDANRRLTISLKDLLEGNRSYVQLDSGDKLPLPVKDLPFVKL